MIHNINGYGKVGSAHQVNNGKKGDPWRSEVGGDKKQASDAAERNYDKAEFSSFIEEPQQNAVDGGMRIGAASDKAPKLSETAQKYLDGLKKKYGNVDFIIADYKTDAEADALLATGKGQYNAVITPALLERMAADEETAAKYEGLIDQSIESIDAVKKEFGEDADMVDKFGTTIDADGNLTLRAKLMEGLFADDGSDTIKASSVEEMLEKLKAARDAQAEKLAELRAKKLEELAAAEEADEVDEAESASPEEIGEMKNMEADIVAKLLAERTEDKQSELDILLGNDAEDGRRFSASV